MKNWSLGGRIAFWSAILFAVAGLLLGVVTTWITYEGEVKSLESELTEDAEQFFSILEKHHAPDAQSIAKTIKKMEPDFLIQAAKPNGELLYRTPKLGTLDISGPDGFHTVHSSEGNLRAGAFPHQNLIVFIAAPMSSVESVTHSVIVSYVIALPVVLICIVLGAHWLARKSLKPVLDITSAAERISAEQLDQRLPVPLARDEIARLTVVLNATFDRLAASYQQAVRFSADASHELKTPLALISITLESLLRRTDLPADAQSEILEVLDDTSRLSTICQNLLLLSRADAGRLQLDRQHAELRAIIEAAMDDAQILAEPNRITITAELPPDAAGTLDPRCVTQILLNLLENAVKYNQHEGLVSVSLSLTPNDFIIRIANTGPGITAEHAAQIFERFFRGDDSRTDFGHGLGLSLSRELARAHGGDLVLESSNAEWTVFLLTLPRDGDKEATPLSGT